MAWPKIAVVTATYIQSQAKDDRVGHATIVDWSTGATLAEAYRTGCMAPKGQSVPASAPNASPAPKVNQARQSITTTKGQFAVPGKAFADGRDFEASPRLTVMKINVWDGVARRQAVCRITHGDAVELISAKRDDGEGRYYFQVRSKDCEGWLPESFLSEREESIIGDTM